MAKREFNKGRFIDLVRKLYLFSSLVILALGIFNVYKYFGPYSQGVMSVCNKHFEFYSQCIQVLNKTGQDAFNFTFLGIIMIIAYFTAPKIYNYLFPLQAK